MRLLRLWLPVIVWAALILSAANDDFSTKQSGDWFRTLFGVQLPWLAHVLLRKAAHVAEYAMLALLAWRAHRSLAIPVAIVLVVASADEWLQSRTTSRTGTVWDVVLDVCAAMLAIIALQTYRQRRRSRG